jgi:hypothetical protein
MNNNKHSLDISVQKVSVPLSSLLELNSRYHELVSFHRSLTTGVAANSSSEYQKGVAFGRKSELEKVFAALGLPLPKIQ